MKKIIVRIAGGLGNQLFMYANAFALSKSINYELFVDNKSGFFKNKYKTNYQLENFNINAELCGNKFRYDNNFKNIKRKFLIKTDFLRKRKMFLIEQKDKFKKTQYFDLDNRVFADTLYVEGHFESELYFSNFKDNLKKQFSLKNTDLFKNNKYLEFIKQNPSVVSICVRQNRYTERSNNIFSNDQIIKSENLTKLTIDYIKRSVEFVDKKISNAKYLVWSNDFNNLRNYLPHDKFIFVDNIKNKALVDFFLLLKCKNFIVGPTTFHWWPAWLNNDQNSLILRPQNINNSDNIDFWPKDWISI